MEPDFDTGNGPGSLLATALDIVQTVNRHFERDAVDSTLVDLARQMRLAQAMQAELKTYLEQLDMTLVERMDEDAIQTSEGWLQRSNRNPSVSNDNEGARTAVRRAIGERLSIDPLTGEIRVGLRNVVEEAVELVYDVMGGTTLKATARRRLNIDPDDFRTETPTGKTVKLVMA